MQLGYRFWRVLPTRVMIAALMTVGGLAIVAPALPASASPTCYGYSCHGHDPNVYGCTVSSETFAYYYSGRTLMATLTNKYSIKCDANWVQGQLSADAVSLGWNFAIAITTTDSKGTGEVMCWGGPGSYNNTGQLGEPCVNLGPVYNDSSTNPAWTDMVDGTNYTKGGMALEDANGNDITYLHANQ